MQPRIRLILLACLALALAILPLFAYIGTFGAQWSTSQEVWGQFGDFFGGFLNPLFALLAFVAVLFNLHLQSQQLEVAREEFRNAAKATQAQIDALREQAGRQELVAIIRSLSNTIDEVLNEEVSAAGSVPKLLLRHVVHEGWRLRAAPDEGGPYKQYVLNARTGGTLIEALHNRLRSAADALAHFLPIYERQMGGESSIVRYYSRRFPGLGMLLAEVGGTNGSTIDFFRSAERESAI
jgi:hypothetical protein